MSAHYREPSGCIGCITAVAVVVGIALVVGCACAELAGLIVGE